MPQTHEDMLACRRRWYIKNSEKCKSGTNKWKKENAERNKDYMRIYRHEYYKKNKINILKKNKERWYANSERDRANDNARRKRQRDLIVKNDPLYWRKQLLKQKYKISVDQYNDMEMACGNVCEICKNPQSNGRKLMIDHCHKTGKIRGLLCINCNFMIGSAKDDKKILLFAVDYLDKK